ncbi:MAG: phosphotransferase [bacterium]|nr:phosphotransferase [bacterium]
MSKSMKGLVIMNTEQLVRDALRTLNLDGCTYDQLSAGYSGSLVFRVRLPNATTRILKISDPAQIPEYLKENYPRITTSERRFYTTLGGPLHLPIPHLLGGGSFGGQISYLLLEDVSNFAYIPSENHLWSETELQSILKTYAQLHGKGLKHFQSHNIPEWLSSDPRTEYSCTVILQSIKNLHENHWTREQLDMIASSPNLPFLVREISNYLRSEPPTLLHNDFYPSNIAFPPDCDQAILFDWQLVGYGPLHLDLVNIGFLSIDPYFSQVNSLRALDYYLDNLAKETGERRNTVSFLKEYRLAELLYWSSFLPRVAGAMHRYNDLGQKFFDPWMATMFQKSIEAINRRICAL